MELKKIERRDVKNTLVKRNVNLLQQLAHNENETNHISLKLNNNKNSPDNDNVILFLIL